MGQESILICGGHAMEIPVLVETLPQGRGFRARSGEPIAVCAESADRANAIEEVRRKLDALVASGQVVSLPVGQPNPAAALIGTLDMNDPRAQEWWQYVQEFRDECDSLVFPGESAEAAR
jgi:hypothetical protein